MRSKNKRWLYTWIILWTYLQLLYCEANDFRGSSNRNGSVTFNNNKETRGLFSPRMDYEQWKPILNGDPLKNDPTFDYVPPMVEAVRYWRDTNNNHRKVENNNNQINQKKDILILGVSSKKPSTSSASIPENPNRREYFDPFLKYVKEPSYQRHRQHLPLTSPYFTPSIFLSKLTERPPIIENEAIPYTMLLPPPMPISKKPVTTHIPEIHPSTKIPFSSSPPTSSDFITVDQAKLIYQSSTHGLTDWLSDQYTTAETHNVATWKTPPSHEPILNNIIDKHEKSNETNQVNMHKGQVEDDELDTYVNIGKLEAHMDSVSGMGISGITIKPPNFGVQVLRPMSIPNLIDEKINEITQPSLETLTSSVITTTTSLPTTTITSKPSTTTTSTASSLTTDPLFKHYKQSMDPIRGPLYLIIQGHSKVKTYGPSKQIHGISVQESNEIIPGDNKEFINVKHLHKFKVDENEMRKPRRTGKSANLQTLKHVVQTRLGSIDFGEIDREVEYKVSQEGESDEKYQKGIVETGAIARRKRLLR
nr:uncharacterized protein LOC111415930 [Onthophagus taurus]XP_022903607.1 uncharacterized protein LOC111415930 [Onthophagus taurus]